MTSYPSSSTSSRRQADDSRWQMLKSAMMLNWVWDSAAGVEVSGHGSSTSSSSDSLQQQQTRSLSYGQGGSQSTWLGDCNDSSLATIHDPIQLIFNNGGPRLPNLSGLKTNSQTLLLLKKTCLLSYCCNHHGAHEWPLNSQHEIVQTTT